MEATNLIQPTDDNVKKILKEAGFANSAKITDTLQGSVWKALQASSNQNVVVKVTSKYLHQNSMAISNGAAIHNVYEDIVTESNILKYLTQQEDIPNSIIKYHDFFERDRCYFLVMENGGSSLFDFIVRAHQFVVTGTIEISEWHKVVKIIFKQMIECIEFIHSKGVCHFDLSMENFLINDVKIKCSENCPNGNQEIQFVKDDIRIKLCDFGLAERFNVKNAAGGTAFYSHKFVGKRPYKSPEIVKKEKYFNAKSNDIWCTGIMLFMMIIGSGPWSIANKADHLFRAIFHGGFITQVLKSWNKFSYVNHDIIELFQLFFKSEDKRIVIEEIKKHSWLK